MSSAAEKPVSPAYGSYKTLNAFSNEVRDEIKHVPQQVDRSLMSKFSGSAATETITTLRFLGLVSGEKAVPTARFEKFVMANDKERKVALEPIVRQAYKFLLEAPNFDIERATSQQVADLFRAQGISGSTLSRAVSFFLAAAKDAGIKVSANIKAPASPRGSGKPKKEKQTLDVTDPAKKRDPVVDTETTHKFELPIPGKSSVVVLIPKDLDAADWDMFKSMFTLYVDRWKNFKPTKPEQKT